MPSRALSNMPLNRAAVSVQLLFHALSFGNVETNSRHANRFAVFVPLHYAATVQDPFPLARPGLEADIQIQNSGKDLADSARWFSKTCGCPLG